MRLLIDNALSPIVAEQLNKAGHDAVHVHDIGMHAAADHQILSIAEEQDRIIVSADTDFGTLLTLRDRSKPSFVLLRRQQSLAPNTVATLLIDTLPSLQADLESGAVVVITDERIRVRSLPVTPAE